MNYELSEPDQLCTFIDTILDTQDAKPGDLEMIPSKRCVSCERNKR